MRRIGLCLGAASLLMVKPVDAADLAPPPILAAPGWTGFYLGGQVGGFVSGRGSQTFSSGDGGPTAAAGFGGIGGRTGNAVGRVEGPTAYQGFHIGYNWQLEHAVLGVEGSFDSLGQIDDILASTRARVGYAVGPVLFYSTVGAAFEVVSSGTLAQFVGGNGGNGGNGGPAGDGGSGGNGFGTLAIVRGSSLRVGFVGGLGTEVKVSPEVGIGVEALYYAFDRNSIAVPHNAVALNGRITYHMDKLRLPWSSEYASWAGFYGGGEIGAAYNLSSSVIDTIALANGQNGTAGTRGIDGGGGGGGGVAFASLQRYASFIGGVHAGYNWQAAHLVYGAEGDIDFSTDKSHKFLASVRGRLGWAFENALVYATGGVAFDRNEAFRTIFGGNGGNGGNGGAVIAAPGGPGGLGGAVQVFGNDDTRVGFVVGGGLQTQINSRTSWGVETLYYGFDHGATPTTNPLAGRTFFGSSRDDAIVARTRISFSLEPY